ncbi:MAG: protein kinase, partial [Planctomycetota bacterium]
MPAQHPEAEAAASAPASSPLLRLLPMHEGFRILDRRWVLFETLGQGGMGVVFRGKHHVLDEEVAVKCLNPGLLHAGGELLSRFRKEAKAATLVKDPHVVTVRDLAEDGDVHFIVMEYVKGVNLRELVHRHGPLKLVDALRIALALAK